MNNYQADVALTPQLNNTLKDRHFFRYLTVHSRFRLAQKQDLKGNKPVCHMTTSNLRWVSVYKSTERGMVKSPITMQVSESKETVLSWSLSLLHPQGASFLPVFTGNNAERSSQSMLVWRLSPVPADASKRGTKVHVCDCEGPVLVLNSSGCTAAW